MTTAPTNAPGTPRAGRRLVLFAAVTIAYLAAAEVALFGYGAFWSLAALGGDMPARWQESMHIGAYVTQVQGRPPTQPRLVAIGSSAINAGLKLELFQQAWAREPDMSALVPFVAPLSGCLLVEGLMLSQVLSEPPPEYMLLGLGHRDVMFVMPDSLNLSRQAFHVPNVYPSRSAIGNADPEDAAQRVWRRWWPSYQHRILMQQLAVHYRPSQKFQEVEDAAAGMQPTETDGRDIPLLGPWAEWCHARGTQPIIVMMPEPSRSRTAYLRDDEEPGYVERCANQAAARDIWFADFSAEIPDDQFHDHIHVLRPGAVRLSGLIAELVARKTREAVAGP